MAVFLTGSSGYIGAHVAAGLLARQDAPMNLLIRARSEQDARTRLWRALQLHLEFPRFREFLETRLQLFLGDLTAPRFGLADGDYRRLVRSTDSIIHCAASLNRKSEKTCLNVNLRGTLEVIKLAMAARGDHGLRRFSHVSTVAVAGHRHNEVVTEDHSVDWERSDYDPYARTKKLCEHMIRELLPDVPQTIFRPSIVLGDSRRAETTQFDMVRAFAFLASLPVLPLRPDDRIDIVPVDYVAESIVDLHSRERTRYDTYHLSSGGASQTYGELTRHLSKVQGTSRPLFVPLLERPFIAAVTAASHLGHTPLGYAGTLMKVFMPYLVWNTVFDNARIVEERGRRPRPFSEYSAPLLRFSRSTGFKYPYQDWPAAAGGSAA